MHFDHSQETSGSVVGGLTTIASIILGFISVESVVQTAVCAAIGASVGYIVTYLFKKITNWLERKLKIQSNKNDT